MSESRDSDSKRSQKGPKNPYILFVGIGIELIGIELTAAYVGYLIDQHYGWPGFAIAALTLGGLVFWLYHVVVLLKKIEDKDESE